MRISFLFHVIWPKCFPSVHSGENHRKNFSVAEKYELMSPAGRARQIPLLLHTRQLLSWPGPQWSVIWTDKAWFRSHFCFARFPVGESHFYHTPKVWFSLLKCDMMCDPRNHTWITPFFPPGKGDRGWSERQCVFWKSLSISVAWKCNWSTDITPRVLSTWTKSPLGLPWA